MNSKRRFINVNYTMSYEEHEEGFAMPEFHMHNDYEIYILARGTRIVSVSEQTFVTGAGDAVLFASEEPHKSKGDEGFAGICIHFSERYLKRYFSDVAVDMFKSMFEQHKVIGLGADSLAVIKKMTREFVTDEEDNFMKLAGVFAMLESAVKKSIECGVSDSSLNAEEQCGMKLMRGQSRSGYTADAVNLGGRGGRTAEIFAYVEENYKYIKTIEELAERFDVSESYIFRIFKQRYAMTPKNYINKIRIKNVCRMLKYYDGTIKNIAQECGFESYEYFNRVFKKEMGRTPVEYRKGVRKFLEDKE